MNLQSIYTVNIYDDLFQIKLNYLVLFIYYPRDPIARDPWLFGTG
jgi:hypothetical protein